ncbi:MAG: type II secretion system protein [Patescibacteria group bacterium]
MRKKGFTLIELLVVISIIGLLSSMAVYAINSARVKARDTKRKADLKQIQLAIELFYDATGSYPKEGCNEDSSNGCSHTDSWWTGNGLAGDYLGHNISEFTDLPIDPLNDSTHYYHYEPHCQLGNTKQGYWIRVHLEENGSWYFLKNGIQDNDLGCENKCDSGPPCY